jgi:hypothetical protein
VTTSGSACSTKETAVFIIAAGLNKCADVLFDGWIHALSLLTLCRSESMNAPFPGKSKAEDPCRVGD